MPSPLIWSKRIAISVTDTMIWTILMTVSISTFLGSLVRAKTSPHAEGLGSIISSAALRAKSPKQVHVIASQKQLAMTITAALQPTAQLCYKFAATAAYSLKNQGARHL